MRDWSFVVSPRGTATVRPGTVQKVGHSKKKQGDRVIDSGCTEMMVLFSLFFRVRCTLMKHESQDAQVSPSGRSEGG